MSVFLQLMKGELDDFIKWPFDKLITFVLIHPDDRNKCWKRRLREALKTKSSPHKAFIKPLTEENGLIGFENFISLEKLHADGFIKNDTIYMRCVIG